MSGADEPVAILRVGGSESTLALREITPDRLLAEARAVGLEEFCVFCNGEEVTSPADLLAIEGAIYVITPPEEDFDDGEDDEIEEEDSPAP